MPQSSASVLFDSGIPEIVERMALPGILPLATPAIYGRLSFLESLQIHTPKFWRELRDSSWEDGSQEIIASWMIQHGVCDEWLIDVVWDTVNHWRQHRDSPASRLETGKPWFNFRQVNEELFDLPPFQPKFMSPVIRPAPVTEDGGPELRRQAESDLAQSALFSGQVGSAAFTLDA